METKEKTTRRLRPLLPLLPPVLLSLLFYLFRGRQALMDGWVIHVMTPGGAASGPPVRPAPLLPGGGAVTSFSPPALSASSAARCWPSGSMLRMSWAGGWSACSVPCFGVWTGYCWLWSAGYYSASFAEKSGLETRPYTVSTLAQVTLYFACQAADLSTQMVRDSEGHFAEDLDDCFRRGVSVYEELEQKLPCLAMPSVPCKPMFFSRLQSVMGFTGVYFPFTGEANVNVDAPACLVPATIAHEMSHQRMVFSELEANFVGIAAAVSCGDPVFQYSGWLMGLIQLCNALYAVSPDLWYQIAAASFTPELSTDWEDNNAYWRALESPVEEAAAQTFDTFLKSNGQDLGIQSYGACVDLLVTWFGDEAGAF